MITLYGLILLILGIAVGCQLRMAWEQHIANQIERSHRVDDNTNLYAVMESALKTIDDSNKALNPPHEAHCNCAYCEIKYGIRKLPATRCVCKQEGLPACRQRAVADKDAELVYHPEYIRALAIKTKELQTENMDLRTELERRDREAASSYPRLPPAKPGESYVMDGEDGSVIVVRGPEVADNETQGPVVAYTPEWNAAT